MNEGKYIRTHKAIIEKGIELFHEKGYDAVTIGQICDILGISRPTFYLHFRTKEELVAAYFDELHPEEDLMEQLDAASPDPWTTILRFLMQRIYYTCDPAHVDLISQYVRYRLQNAEDQPIIRHDAEENNLTKLVRRAQAQGIIKNPSDPNFLADSILMLQDGNLLRWCTKRGSFDRLGNFFWNLEAILEIADEYRGLWKLEC